MKSFKVTQGKLLVKATFLIKNNYANKAQQGDLAKKKGNI